MTTRDEKENAEKEAEAKEKSAEAVDKKAKAQKEYLDWLTETTKESREHYEVLKKSADALGDHISSRKAEGEILEKIIEEELRQALIQSGITDEKEQQRQLEIEIKKIKEGQTSSYVRHLDAEKARLRLIHQTAEGQKKYGAEQKKILGDLAQGLGINVNFSNTFLGNMNKVATAIAKGGEEGREASLAFQENFKQLFSWQNMAASTFAKIFEMSAMLATEFDKATASLAASTQMGQEFNSVLFQSQRETNLFGVTMGDASEAAALLNSQTSQFIKLNQNQRSEMIKTTAMLKKLGVDGMEAAKTFQFFNLNLGKSATAATKAQKQLAMMGRRLGKNAKEMTQEFNASLKILAVYGDEAVDVFSNLAAAAKAAGVETSSLLSVVKKFDTFTGAAEGAAHFNALLGSQLSTTQMLMMKEDERLETLVATVQAQGIAFKDMDKFTQLAIAQAAGIDDINEAQRIFGMSLSEYQENKDMMDKQAAAQAKFDQAVRDAIPSFIKFKNLATELVTAVEPTMKVIAEWAESITVWLQSMEPEEKDRLVFWTALGTGIALVGTTLLPVISGFVMYRNAMKSLQALQVAGSAINKKEIIETKMKIKLNNQLAAAQAKVAASTKGATAGGLMGMGAIKAIGVAVLVVGALVAAYVAYAAARAMILEQEAKIADARAREIEARARQVKDMKNIGSAFKALASVNFATATANVGGMISELKKLGGGEEIMVKTRSTIENLALVSAGKAKDSMTGKTIAANNITANIQNVFKNMTMVVDIGGDQFDAKVKSIATEAAAEVVAGPH